LTKRDRYKKAIAYFEANHPVAQTELSYKSAYELIVAVVLSAQCTDVRVNTITPEFFRNFPDEISLANAKEEDVFRLIKSCSYPNNKTKNLIGMAKTLIHYFNGIVPDDVDELLQLPGVGRKSANVIASVVFRKPAMAVDTHVFRVSARIGLTTNSRTPLDTERQLVQNIPENKISLAHHWLILHGRYICKSRKPLCADCGMTDFCKFFAENNRNK
jgi:endonuclease-3